MTRNPWISHTKSADAHMRLFVLPFAGGSASSFRGWENGLPDSVQFCPVHLPGRERRMLETPFNRMSQLIPELAAGIMPYLDKPYALFGHSMGSVIAWELASHFAEQGAPGPQLLIASGHGAPCIKRTFRPISDLPDNAFLDAVSELSGLPEDVLNSQELREFFLPVLRADFSLCETYAWTQRPKLSFPIIAFGGRQDPIAGETELASWQSLTDQPLRIEWFNGNHFFIESDKCVVLRQLSSILSDLADQLGPKSKAEFA